MWTRGKEGTAEQMKNAAAAILAQTKPTARQILEGARNEAKTDTAKTNLGIALLTGYSNLQEYEKLYALASERAKQSPESKGLFFDQEIALRALHRYVEADALAQEMGKRLPDDTDIRRAFNCSEPSTVGYFATLNLDTRSGEHMVLCRMYQPPSAVNTLRPSVV